MTWILALAMTCVLTFPVPQSADEREVLQYRLTSEALAKVEAVAKAFEANVSKDPKVKKRLDAKRELDALDAKDTLTPAEQKRADELSRIVEEGESDDPGIDAGSLSEMSARLMKNPPMAAALKSVGMPARDMVKFMLAALQAAMADAMGGATPAGVAGENVKFVSANRAAIERINKLLGTK